MDESVSVVHNEAQQRFEVSIDDARGIAEYRHVADDALEFHHTLVPVALRGRGLAGKLVEAGLNFARDNGMSVIPTCSYVAGYIERHPQYRALLKDD